MTGDRSLSVVMMILELCIILLYIGGGCSQSGSSPDDVAGSGGGLGGSYMTECNATSQCTDKDTNTYCYRGRCQCNSGYTPESNNQPPICVPYFNAECNEESDCIPQLTAMLCGNAGRCVCQQGLKYDTGSKMCKYGYGQTCSWNEDCSNQNLACKDTDQDGKADQCQCAPGYSYYNNKCIRVLGGNCNTLTILREICPGVISGECSSTGDVSLCQCRQGEAFDPVSGRCIQPAVGQKCTGSGDCTSDSHSVCDTSAQVCVCQPGFMKSATSPFICIAVVNSTCSSTCPTGSNTLCTSGRCLCEQGYFHNETTHTCQLVYGYPCRYNTAVCQRSGDSNAYCRYNFTARNSFCDCVSSYFYNNVTNLCDPVVGSSCSDDQQCKDRYRNINTISCQDSTGDGTVDTCLCKEGYFRYYETNRCERIMPRTACRDGFFKYSRSMTPQKRKKRVAEDVVNIGNNDQGTCIMVNSNPLIWPQAVLKCREHFSNMLSLSDLTWPDPYMFANVLMGVRNDIDGIRDKRFWTGMRLTSEPTREKFIWEGQFPHPVNYTYHRIWQWGQNQPLPLHGRCGVGTVLQYGFRFPLINVTTQKCDTELPSVCANTAVQAELLEGFGCPDGWKGSHVLDKCFKFVATPSTYRRASRECTSSGGRLYIPTSQFEREFVFAEFMLKEVQYARVGVQCANSTGSCNMANGQRKNIADLFATIGLSRNEDYFNEEEYVLPTVSERPDTFCLAFRQSVSLGEGPSSSVSYYESECENQLPYICEMDSQIPESKVSISLPVYNKTSQTLSYNLYGFDEGTPVTFIKDGLVNLNKKVVIANSTVVYPLEFSQQQQQESSWPLAIGDHQGYYSIRVWGKKPYAAYNSRKYLVRDENIYTITGTLKALKLGGSPRQYTEPLLFVAGEYSNAGSAVAQMYTTIQNIGRGVSTAWRLAGTRYQANVDMKLTGLREEEEGYVSTGGLLADFRAYITLNRASESAVSALRQARQVSPITVEIEDNKVVQKLESALSDVVEQYGFIGSSVVLRSTKSCSKEVVLMPSGVRVTIPVTDIGEVAVSTQRCLDESGIPLGTRPCQGNFTYGADWGVVTLNCQVKVSSLTPKLGLLANINTTADNVVEIVSNAANLTEENGTELTSTDIIYTSQIIDAVSEVENVTDEIGVDLLRTVNNVLRSGRRNIAVAQRFDNSSSRITGALERFARKFKLRGRKKKRFVRPNVAIEIWDVDPNDPVIGLQSRMGQGNGELNNNDLSTIYGANTSGIDYSETDAAIILPKEIFDRDSKTSRVTFTVYQESSFFLSQQELNSSVQFDSIHTSNSRVVAAAVGGKQIKGLQQPVVTVYKPLKNFSDSYQFNNTVCEFWDFSLNGGFGGWSSDGCTYQGMKNGRYVCHCDHLTNFAVLVDLYGQENGISQENKLALSIITIIGLSLSIAGLSMVILTFICFKKLRQGRTQQTLFNLALAILCSNIIFLAGINQTQSYAGCIAVAVLLHYFILASFMWMLVEAILQYLDFVKVLGTYISKFILKAAIPAWLIPAIACAVVLGIDVDLYKGGEEYCWMKTTAFYYSFLIPVGTIILANTIIFILVIKGLTCDRPKNIRTNQSKHKVAMVHLRAGICCFVVLGLTWVFGFFAIADARLVFQYLFCIFNAIQGFLIFIFHNIREPRVREAWQRLCCKKQHRREKYEKANMVSSSNNTNSNGDGSSTPRRSSNANTTSTGYTTDSSGYTELQYKNHAYNGGN
ncbi:uncharacterized protein LOC106166554 isoform X2 [Lingula anatina]|uniref:Uncharacterized protein LOC106166554 isoform X2 n=1 Tax=Lingula anatina TaxID=7574 RepID=A0A1S3IQW6_LINAN|nr:uncharacterized protein LOC106166554 isoform X2 [Lingula anatina]|eukprot:XP_013400610.1 uncharacterized protein LOC106166554 isoform X2 [Lingula anatina]